MTFNETASTSVSTSTSGKSVSGSHNTPTKEQSTRLDKDVSVLSLNNLIQRFPNLLDENSLEKIQGYAHSLNFQAHPSFVFNRETEENTIDPEVRKSKTCTTKDAGLMTFLNDYVLCKMNEIVKGLYTFKLARDYVTFIRYDEGDFFDWHVDFEKVRVNHGENGFKEMHFLFCVQGCLEGGELLIKEPKQKSTPAAPAKSLDSEEAKEIKEAKEVMDTWAIEADVIKVQEAKTTNAAVVFDKLMEHKGARVTKGTKIIMTIDLYVLSQARVKAGLSQQVEQEISDLLSQKREWVSLRGDAMAFKTVWDIIYSTNKKDFVPFLEMQAEVGSNSYHILAIPKGVVYVKLLCDEKTEYEYRANQWYFTLLKDDSYWSPKTGHQQIKMQDIGVKKRFTLRRQKEPEYRYQSGPFKDNYLKNQKAQQLSEKISFRNDLVKVFRENLGNPVQMFEDMIIQFSGNQETYDLNGFPKIELEEFSETEFSETLINLPTYCFEKEFASWGWNQIAAGYSYHCNEPSYEHFDINYRYGIMRLPTSNVTAPATSNTATATTSAVVAATVAVTVAADITSSKAQNSEEIPWETDDEEDANDDKEENIDEEADEDGEN